jgi:hypothetical protein
MAPADAHQRQYAVTLEAQCLKYLALVGRMRRKCSFNGHFFAEMTGFKTKSLPLIKRQALIVSSETGSVVIGFRQYLKRWRRGDVEAAVDVMTFTGHAT